MKSLAKSILTEMALDLGDAPDWIDPQKKRKITQGQHPYADNPAFPQQKPPRRAGTPYRDDPNRPDPTRSYSELITSHVYPEIVRKVQQYTGRNPRQMNPQQLMMLMMQAMQHAVRAEAGHRPELEQAAVEIVLGLPEFRDAREAIEAGFYNIDIDSSTVVDLSKPTEEEQQRNNFTIAAEITAMIREIEPRGITVSVGVACYPDRAVESPESFIALADAALYRAKADGRNVVRQ